MLRRTSDEEMVLSTVVMAHAWNRLLAGNDDPDDVRERVVALLEASIRGLQSHLALQLLGHPVAHLKSLTLMSVALEACLLSHPAPSYELCVQPTKWSLTDCASRS